ncbi:dioxygenase [Pseudonocardia nantongensis]|uniref:dioxygenase family protein n=1 Tax=Pseudonocardia nantongensis TaxID=1181885 RepID=UPI00397C2A4F
MDFTEEAAVTAVKESFAPGTDPRLAELVGGLVDHLHTYVREVRPTVEEWNTAIGFLTAVGQTCSDTRQEFVLLSDVLGVSMLIETINGQETGTESTVLGPFHMTESPRREIGDSIDELTGGRDCVVELRVLGADGTPLPGATVDVWQATAEGFYDVQQPDVQPPGNGRGLFTADDEGRVRFRSVVPSHYPIPTDGPVGELLGALGRHGYRPAHVHVIASAAGHRELTTHLFVADSAYIDSDAVFAVKRSLIVDFEQVDDQAVAARYGIDAPFRLARYDVVLDPAPAQA